MAITHNILNNFEEDDFGKTPNNEAPSATPFPLTPPTSSSTDTDVNATAPSADAAEADGRINLSIASAHAAARAAGEDPHAIADVRRKENLKKTAESKASFTQDKEVG